MGQSITEALGLTDEFLEKSFKMVDGEFKNSDTISDVIIKTALDVREEDLGDLNGVELSTYEKKLLFLGFMIGHRRASLEAREQFANHPLFQLLKGIKRQDEDDCE